MASKEAASGPVAPEEASPRESATPAVSAELVETIRAVVGELLSKRRDSEGGTSSRGAGPAAASGAGTSTAPSEGG